MKTYIEQLSTYTNLYDSLISDIYQSVLLDPSFVHDNVTADSGTLTKTVTYTKNSATITITQFKIKQNGNVELTQDNGQTPITSSLDIAFLLEIYDGFTTFEKVAKEVTFEFKIRVIVKSDATELEISEKAFQKLRNKINDAENYLIEDWKNNPITLVQDDLSKPYDSSDIGND